MLVSGGWIEDWPDAQAAANYRKMNNNVHSPEEARKVTHDLIAAGADGIKLYTGLSVAEIRASTDEAHRMGKFVGRHVYTDKEIQDAIAGGVDFLDHGGSGHQNPLFSEETLRMMVARNIPVGQSIGHRVTLYPAQLSWPERLDNPELRQELGKYADVVLGSLRKPFSTIPYFGQIQAQMRIAPKATRQLHDAGVKIIMGTDSGTPGNFHSESVWREMEALVRMAGLTPNEAIVAATRDAAAALKVNTGVIAPGRLADLILIKGNPLDDIIYVQNVAHVVKDGVQFK
jgi:imidazolonepropionase-like amidohydrolase